MAREKTPARAATLTTTPAPTPTILRAAVPEGFKSVGGPGNTDYFKYAACAVGQVLVDQGTYLGKKVSKFGGFDHEFKLDTGRRVLLNKAGKLALLLKDTAVGTRCYITYEGTEVLGPKAQYPGADCHQFQVLEGDVGPVTAEYTQAQVSTVVDWDISL